MQTSLKSKPKINSKFKNEHKPGVFTNSKPLLDKDTEINKSVLKGVQLKHPILCHGADTNLHNPSGKVSCKSDALAKTILPYRAPPKVRPFNCDDFIKSLGANGLQLTSRFKGDWAGLYKRFPTFDGWFNARAREISVKLTLLQLES